MKYENIVTGKYISRPNRFIAEVEIGGQVLRAHVKNTGRLRELLVPGADVYLEDFKGRMGKRKLAYSLIAVENNGRIVNIDSQSPNSVAAEALNNGTIRIPGLEPPYTIKREKTYRNSRFDIYIEDCNGKKGFIEVKGCTLDKDGTAMFPDAPTQRGEKHIRELISAAEDGYTASALILIQYKGADLFRPNAETDPGFASAMRDAAAAGVNILCYDCDVTASSISVSGPVPYSLHNY